MRTKEIIEKYFAEIEAVICICGKMFIKDELNIIGDHVNDCKRLKDEIKGY